MENQICAHCGMPVQPEEAALCPACGTLHHNSCWYNNGGCAVPGCSANTRQAAPAEVNQEIPVQAAPAVCKKCGSPLAEGTTYCPVCGYQDMPLMDQSTSDAINQFNANIDQPQKKSKLVPIIIAASAALLVVLGIVFGVSAAKKKAAEEARDEYIDAAEEFYELALDAGTNLEDVVDTVQNYWYDNIWYDKHGNDIDDAVAAALRDKSSELDQAEDYDEDMQRLYNQLKTIPDNVSDEDARELKKIRDAVKELYSVYGEFYDMATDPSGSYNSYSEANEETTDEYIAALEDLSDALD